jgi:hypothetical protein
VRVRARCPNAVKLYSTRRYLGENLSTNQAMVLENTSLGICFLALETRGGPCVYGTARPINILRRREVRESKDPNGCGRAAPAPES